MRAIVSVVIVLTCAVAVPPSTAAQTVTGVVHGTVTDTTQASIPGVSVTASEAETGLVRHAVTSEQGYYGVSDQHPVALSNPALEHGSRHDQITEYFDTAAFAMPDIGTYGNAGKGLISGPGSAIVDLAVLKDLPLPLTPGAHLQLRAELFNLFNRPNFGNPDTNLSSARFGQITTAGAGREIQVGLKVLW